MEHGNGYKAAWECIIVPRLSKQTLRTLAQTSKAYRVACLETLYGDKATVFQGNGALPSLLSFLRVVSRAYPVNFKLPPLASFIKRLVLVDIEGGLYDEDRLPDDWLTLVALKCSSLTHLELRNSSPLLSDSIVQRLLKSRRDPLPLESLVLTDLRNLTAKSLASWIVILMPQLKSLTLVDCGPALTDALVSTLFCSSDNGPRHLLEKLSLSRTGSLSSNGISQSFYSTPTQWSRLNTLDLEDCPLLTDDALIAIGSAQPPLESLSLSRSSRVSVHGLISLCTSIPALHHLDIGYIEQLNMSITNLSTLTSTLSSLRVLRMSYSPIDSLRTDKPLILSAFSALSHLHTLIFTSINERTPCNIIRHLSRHDTLPSLKALVLCRDRYTRDDVLGVYAQVTESHLIVDEAFVEGCNKDVGVWKNGAWIELQLVDSRGKDETCF